MNNQYLAATPVLTETARMTLEDKLAIALQEYDNDQHKRSLSASKRRVYYNPSANRLYFEALERAMCSLQFEGVTVEMALAENFTGHLLKTLLKTYIKMLNPQGLAYTYKGGN
jgi:hypothetical protein